MTSITLGDRVIVRMPESATPGVVTGTRWQSSGRVDAYMVKLKNGREVTVMPDAILPMLDARPCDTEPE